MDSLSLLLMLFIHSWQILVMNRQIDFRLQHQRMIEMIHAGEMEMALLHAINEILPGIENNVILFSISSCLFCLALENYVFLVSTEYGRSNICTLGLKLILL